MWSNRDWIGSLYPKGANSKSFLHHYSQTFSTVEGNTTFYALPSSDTVESWRSQAASGFKFSFKLPKTITHERSLRSVDTLLTEFFDRLSPLAEHQGVYMIQLPAEFGADSLPILSKFLDQLPSDLDFSVEVRHPVFFNRGDEEKQLNQLLHSKDVDRVCFDSRALFSEPAVTDAEKDAQRKKPQLPVHALVTAKHPIIRFIGSSDLTKNEDFLIPWRNKLNEWRGQGKVPYIFIHTPSNQYAVEQAVAFSQLLGWSALSLNQQSVKQQLDIF